MVSLYLHTMRKKQRQTIGGIRGLVLMGVVWHKIAISFCSFYVVCSLARTRAMRGESRDEDNIRF